MARQTRWVGRENKATVVGGTKQFQEVLAPATSIEKGETIVRIRGSMGIVSTTAESSVRNAAAGLILTDDSAVVGGMPDPMGNLDADWLWHTWLVMTSVLATHFPTDGVMIDNKSMRRIASGQKRLAMVMNVESGRTALIGYGLRILVKLH